MQDLDLAQDVHQTISKLFANRTEYFRLTQQLENQTDLRVDDWRLQNEIDGEHSGKRDATIDDVRAILKSPSITY